MAQCSFIHTGGTRCKITTKDGAQLCHMHDPLKAEARSKNAAAGGRRAGRGRPLGGAEEIVSIKQDLSRIIEQVEAGRLERGRAAVIGQLFNILLRSIEVERRMIETDQLVERLERLEDRLGGRAGWRT